MANRARKKKSRAQGSGPETDSSLAGRLSNLDQKQTQALQVSLGIWTRKRYKSGRLVNGSGPETDTTVI